MYAGLRHLVANSLFGAAFGVLLGRHLGFGLAWLLVVVCAVLANAVNADVRPTEFASIGASTVTFAASPWPVGGSPAVVLVVAAWWLAG